MPVTVVRCAAHIIINIVVVVILKPLPHRHYADDHPGPASVSPHPIITV